ncbi:HAD-IA family hydrolase [Plantactinospora sp. S1510]|uniref:HAD-IA family hydrolase n=1 Tax=Plantactinospora alkalitolerans TaxID=2789879 RepID=A0ABS0GTZ0_9ACTN|nr:HAD-IA family hydrolase [Plantactinospora alkalitolerans]MBF9129656.1 HAD-IA family hydrolase [Plantactinospora alkalitolerans]
MATSGVLFDVDGVLLDTVEIYQDIWGTWARRRSLDVAHVLGLMHGRRTEDLLSRVAPQLDVATECAELDGLMRERIELVRPAPTARVLLESLHDRPWAIVTSGNRWSVRLSFESCGLPLPQVQVYGEEVPAGKPSPDCYLMAAERLGISAADCLAVEDAPAGILAAKRAGCTVLAIASTHDPAELGAADMCLPTLAHAVEIIQGFRSAG